MRTFLERRWRAGASVAASANAPDGFIFRGSIALQGQAPLKQQVISFLAKADVRSDSFRRSLMLIGASLEVCAGIWIKRGHTSRGLRPSRGTILNASVAAESESGRGSGVIELLASFAGPAWLAIVLPDLSKPAQVCNPNL